jgi:hypothetical protein
MVQKVLPGMRQKEDKSVLNLKETKMSQYGTALAHLHYFCVSTECCIVQGRRLEVLVDPVDVFAFYLHEVLDSRQVADTRSQPEVRHGEGAEARGIRASPDPLNACLGR